MTIPDKNKPVTIFSTSPEQTRELGRCLGRVLRSGAIIRLDGDLASGKTCFVQGLARGLEVDDSQVVSSPTYTLINEYAGRLALFHVDLYRLISGLDIEGIGLWDLFGADAVVAVEWADRLEEGEWPCPNLLIRFAVEDDCTRRVDLFGCGLGADNLIRDCVAEFAKTEVR